MKKRWLPVAVSLALVLGGCARFGASSSSLSSASSLPENAETVYGRVSYVSGNDFTLALGTYGAVGQGGADAGRPADDDSGVGAEESSRGQRSGGSGSGQAGGPGGQGDFNGGGEMPTDGAPAGDPPADMSDFAGGEAGASAAGGGQASQRFTETGEELEIRIPVGTPIYYGTLKVDFSQIQIDYVISVSTIPDNDGEPVVIAAEILST